MIIRGEDRFISISALDAAILLIHVMKGMADRDVGFEDADKTYEQIRNSLNRTFMISKDTIESALWSCNLLNEQGKFTHPDEMSFDGFVAKMAPKKRFDHLRNLLESK